MDYELLLHEILNIGKEMIKSGAETNRTEDSLYRMLESYDVEHCSVFAIQSDIQATIKPVGGAFITQIRRVHRTGFHYDRLDYLNNLSRYICKNQPYSIIFFIFYILVNKQHITFLFKHMSFKFLFI